MAKEEFNEHSGLEFSCWKVLPPEAIGHDEYLQYCVRDVVHALLKPPGRRGLQTGLQRNPPLSGTEEASA